MKRFRPSVTLLLLMLLMAACDNRDLELQGDGRNGTLQTAVADSLYFKLQVITPADHTGQSTRATAVNSGDASEYAVKDGILALFIGDEGDATLQRAYQLEASELPEEKDRSSQITTHSYIIKTEETSENIYALVLLNNTHSGFTCSGGMLLKDGESLAGKKIADLQTLTIGDWGNETDGFFMSNAPMSLKPGGKEATPPTGTTVQIQVTNLFKDGASAIANDATIVCVERAAAKVSVSWNKTLINTQYKNALSGEDYGTSIRGNSMAPDTYIKLYDIAWGLDQTNQQSYALRHFEDTPWLGYKATGSEDYRFATDDVIGDILNDNHHFYRTTWATDANPDGNTGLSATPPVLDKKSGESVYCFENTTTATAMEAPNLTRVVLQVQVTDDAGLLLNGTFWGISGGGNIDEQAVLTNETYLRSYLKQNKGKVSSVASEPDDQFSKLGLQLKAGTSGMYELTQGTSSLTDAQLTDLNAYFSVRKYDRYMYYAAYIRHFNDDETPWTSGVYTASDHLGRYGVVRDNWYRITLTRFDRIGYPSVSDLPTTGLVDELK